MSNYTLTAIYKPTGEVKEIEALDNYYGNHRYGYRDEDGTTYDQSGFDRMFEWTCDIIKDRKEE